MSTTINRYAIHSQPLPPHPEFRELKYCELCGKPFARAFAATVPRMVPFVDYPSGWTSKKRGYSEIRVDGGRRFCDQCQVAVSTPSAEVVAVRSAVLLDQQESYKDQLPTEAEQKHSHHLPKFDQSLLPMGNQTRSHQVNQLVDRKRRKSVKTASWLPTVLAAFREKGTMTMEQVAELIPGAYVPSEAYNKLYQLKSLKLVLVERKRNPGFKGQGPGTYRLELTS